jgi:acyl-CoA dehydrogenase
MAYDISASGLDLLQRVQAFMHAYIYDLEERWEDILAAQTDRWAPVQEIESLKARARSEGLWNLFMPGEQGAGLRNVDYAYLCQEMGRSHLAPEIFNCSAPDTGNMEVLHMYGTEAQKARWLTPLLQGKIRSAFCMTEPAVASSDATNIATSITSDGDDYIINGQKWWSSGASDQRCKLLIVMGCTDATDESPRHKRHAMILVPSDTPGITIDRELSVFGYDHAPNGHAQVTFDNVRVPGDCMLLGEGRGFEIAQGRLGPGRVHHAMRALGIAERALEMMCERASERHAFGRKLYEHGMVMRDIALSRMEIEQARLLTLHVAHLLDTVGAKEARMHIAMIKVAAMGTACAVVDRAIQVHGAKGVCQDTFLAHAYALYRALRMGDGPDEVHLSTIARMEMKPWLKQ